MSARHCLLRQVIGHLGAAGQRDPDRNQLRILLTEHDVEVEFSFWFRPHLHIITDEADHRLVYRRSRKCRDALSRTCPSADMSADLTQCGPFSDVDVRERCCGVTLWPAMIAWVNPAVDGAGRARRAGCRR